MAGTSVLEGEDAAGLDVAAIGADDDAKFDPASLEDGELAALLVKGHVGGALAVRPQDMPLVRHQGRVVQVAAAQLVEADDERGVEAGGAIQQLQGFGGVKSEGML